ncbi:AI-2E family transporter [Lentilactobacillus otakiensis]|nr:AI-2E family transporter [Lentilactobacillus otakiensis]MBZ3776390.1 AI-2E family transporter [Lentilactobacillus otakiensis]MDV3518501.1 AI-2E family transporter [Lentilactobacillus otakiensis]
MLIIFVLYVTRSMISTVLLTFIFSLLVVKLTNSIRRHVKIPAVVIVIVVYLLVILALYFAITKYIPKVADQTINVTQDIINFYSNPKNLPDDSTLSWVNELIKQSNVMSQMKNGVSLVWKYVTGVGTMGITLFLSIMLSFFFTIELKEMNRFSASLLDSDFGWFFQDLAFFGKKFVSTFGVVIEAQFFIALCNTALTTIVIAIMGLPQLAALALMVFIFSLIPVAGVIISFIPLSLVGFSVGGINDVFYLLITIIVIHIFEAYVLNPNFMASKTNLPIFYTFVVLLVGEHFFGIWGLVCGVPIFTFFLDILGVKNHVIKPKKLLRKGS